MRRSVFAVLIFLILGDAAMAQNIFGPSGLAQADHLDYRRHFSQGPTYLSSQTKTLDLINANQWSENEWPEHAWVQVRAGSAEIYIPHGISFDQALSKKASIPLPSLDKELPSFGWNLEFLVSQNKFSDFQNPLLPDEAAGQTPLPQLSCYISECGDALITMPTKEWQIAVDESMRKALREMPKDTKNDMAEDNGNRSGKVFMTPTDPGWIWYTENQGFFSERGTFTKIIGPNGIKLIRITGAEQTQINGTVDAGEQDIFLINPHGIVVGPGGKLGGR